MLPLYVNKFNPNFDYLTNVSGEVEPFFLKPIPFSKKLRTRSIVGI